MSSVARRKGLYVIGALVVLGCAALVAAHELSVRYHQDKTCTVCHEMRDPIRRWKESGAAKNHPDCAGCHFDAGVRGWWEMNRSAVTFLFAHFQRDPGEPIRPKPEPLFLEQGREPGYWTRVPNHRCFQCHRAKNHAPEDQERIHARALKDVMKKPCADCHSHEMRNGQTFYEKVVADRKIEGEMAAPESTPR